MSVVDLALARQRRQKELARRVAAQVARAFAALEVTDLDTAWTAAEKRIVGSVIVAQALATTDATAYVDECVREAGATPARAVVLSTGPFVGSASDGRPLDTLMHGVLIRIKQRIGENGGDVDDALAYGQRVATLYAVNETQATARLADAFAIAAEPRVQGWVRQVVPPACGRCIVLAGRVYARNAGFDRHPRCDCVHVPTLRAGSAGAQSPRQLFDRMSADEQDASFGRKNAAAIRQGADIGQVVNARRGMTAAGDRITTTGSTTARMAPAALLDRYGSDPKTFVAALKTHGYV